MIYCVLLKIEKRTANHFTMKTALLSIGFIVVSLFTLNSCGLGEAKKEAQAAAKIFHKHLKNHNHTSMINMIHPEGLKITPPEQWLEIFEGMDEFGEVQSIKKDAGFSSNYNNGVTTVELNYTIEFKEKTFNEQIIFQKDGETYKVLGYFIQ